MRISDWSSDVGSSDLWQQRRGQALCAAKDQGSSAVAPIGQDKSRAVTRHQRLAVERFDFAVGQHRLGLDHVEQSSAARRIAGGLEIDLLSRQRPQRFTIARKSTRLNSSHLCASRLPSFACNTKFSYFFSL